MRADRNGTGMKNAGRPMTERDGTPSLSRTDTSRQATGEWPQTAAGPRNTGFVKTDGPKTGSRLWKHPYQYSRDTAPVVSGGRVYVAHGKQVKALDVASGEVGWTMTLGDSEVAPAPPAAVVDGLVLVRTGTTLYALASGDGTVSWEYDLPGEQLALTAAGGTLYVWTGTNTRSVIAVLDAGTGEQQARFRTPAGWGQHAVVDGTIYAGFRDSIQALDAADGTRQWKYGLPPADADEAEFFGRTAVAGGRVHMADTAGRLHTLSTDGAPKWRYETEPEPRAGSVPAVANGTVYAGFFDNKVRAFDAETGEEEWAFWGWSIQTGAPAVANETVYIGGWDDMVYALDRSTGKRRWEVSLPRNVGGAAVTDGQVYIGHKSSSEPGWLYALGNRDESR